MALPEWWTWEVELTPHSEARLEERGLAEIDLRTMLNQPPAAIDRDPEAGRYRVFTRHRGSVWIVVVEPDSETRVTVVVSLFRADEP